MSDMLDAIRSAVGADTKSDANEATANKLDVKAIYARRKQVQSADAESGAPSTKAKSKGLPDAGAIYARRNKTTPPGDE